MPLSKSIYIDKALSNISLAYRPTGLIADQLAPRVPVVNDTGNYFIYTRDTLKLPETIRANGAASREANWYLSTGSYSLARHSLKSPVTDMDRSNADPAIKLDADTTEILTDKILVRKEVDLANLCGTAANWGNVTSLTSTWAWSANTTLSNPITFVDSATTNVAFRSGMLANTVALDHRTFKAAKEHVSVLDRIKYTSPDSVTAPMLAKLFNVDRVLVASGVYDATAELYITTTAHSWIWTDVAFIAYIPNSPSLKTPSALYQLTKNEFGNPWKVKKWREEEIEADQIEVSTMYQHKVVASDAAYLIYNTVQ